jgi:hypothetical protein
MSILIRERLLAMFYFSKFEQDIKSNLNDSSKLLIDKLNQISLLNFNPNIDLIDFEIFIEPTRFEIDIMMFSMDKEGNEVFDEGNQGNYFAGSQEIISEVTFYSDDNFPENDDFFEKADEIERQAIIEWFIKCWEQSTCNHIRLPIYVSIHDDLKSYDLKNQIWIDVENKQKMRKIIITTPFIKVIAWIDIVFFLFCAIGSFFSNQADVTPIFLGFVLLGVLMLLMSGKAEITANGFMVLLPIGKYYISWGEVEYIETGAGNLVLGNNNKRLCFPSFDLWSGSKKEEAFELIDQILQSKHLEIKESKRAILPLYKNTKLS